MGPLPLYLGPRPSPARRWAPWVVLGALLTVVADLVAMSFELVERHWQQRLAARNSVSSATIRSAVAHIQDAHNVAVGTAIVTLALWLVWATRRRSRKRVAAHGEVGVERPLREVVPWAVGLVVLTVLASVVCTHIGLGELPPSGRTAADFASYRGWRAASWCCAAATYAALASVVVTATRGQARREAADPADCVQPQPVTRFFGHRVEFMPGPADVRPRVS
ncbi:MAG TPA: hypothetical protein VGI86_05365, partial [Acidimicrobiia bacterium]